MTSDAVPDLVDRYRRRTGLTGQLAPTETTLRALVAAHGRTFAFENLDPLLGTPVGDLSRGALAAKLLDAGRGGYCYEHNGLLGEVLADLGYGVRHLTGRVGDAPAEVSPRTHHVLRVLVPGDDGSEGVPWLVDVGFGGQTLTSPVRLVADVVQETRHEPYRLVHPAGEPDRFALEAQVQGRWRRLYAVDQAPQTRIDREVGSWWVSTHPDSHFTRVLAVARNDDEGRWALSGRRLSRHRVGRPSEESHLATTAEVVEALVEVFGLRLDAEPLASHLHARLDEVLDPAVE